MTPSRPQSRVILVLGMHRSGTSAITRVLNLLGVELGSHLMPAAAGNNASGFWEHVGVVEVHDALLHALGRSWRDPRPLPDDWLHSNAAQVAKAKLAELIKADFADALLWAVKDPRLCRLLPLWRELLAELEIEPCAMMVLRHPDEVARSLRDRDGFPLEQGRLLWLEHVADAERYSRGWRRCIVAYDDVLSDWRPVLDRAETELAVLRWPLDPRNAAAAVDAFLDRGQRHHAMDAVQRNELPALIWDVYNTMRAVAHGEGSWERLASAMDRYNSIADIFVRGYEADSQRRDAEAANRVAAMEYATRQRSEAMLMTLREIEGRTGDPVGAAEALAREDVATLYWRGEEAVAFDESRKVALERTESVGGERLVFRLPEMPRVFRLRIDPSAHPGRFDLLGLRIDQVPVEDFAERVERVNQLCLSSHGAGHVAMVSMDDDPYLEVKVDDLAVDWSHGASVEVHVLRQDLPKVGFDEIWQRLHAGILAVCTRSAADLEQRLNAYVAAVMAEQLKNHGEALKSPLAQLARQTEGLEQRMADLSGSVRQQMARLDDRLGTEMEAIERRSSALTLATAEQLRVEEQTSKTDMLNRLEDLLRDLDAKHAEQLDALSQGMGRMLGRGDIHSTELAELRRVLKAMDDERRKTLLQRLRGSRRRG